MDKIQVLDHGYVDIKESWGSDERIIEAARQSTAGSFRGWMKVCDCCHGDKVCEFPGGNFGPCSTCDGTGELEGDAKLLRYLYRNNHMTPFEMCGATFEVKLPIFVTREWHR